MRRLLFVLLAASSFATSAFAALQPGAPAPLFTATATLGGNDYPFILADALKRGPVVLYFYPAAFTPGCTIEAHDFATAMPQFTALHATVIGVSRDGIAILKKFSVSECRSKFPVAADESGIITKEYDATIPTAPAYANRISYVIAPTGQIIYTYDDPDPADHVKNTMAAVKAWDLAHPAP
ncbi:MAG: peroxiredoxin [Acidocella sp.]|nr:peroxiredoxin [Acidocella sp.]